MKQTPQLNNELNGALLIDKPAGETSAGIVRKLKKHFALKRVGHAGTLDPMATGLLVILCGKATRLQSFFLESTKAYSGVIRLGLSTETDDIEGRVTEIDEKLAFLAAHTPAELECNIKQNFSGRQQQRPPQFSAIHVDGKRSYDLARKGKGVSLEPREVEIAWEEIELIPPNHLRYQVRCSKGTYIRSLARDIGSFLKSCACLESIRRLESSPFRIQDAISLDDLFSLRTAAPLLPLETLVSHLPKVVMEEEDCESLGYGRQEVLGKVDLAEKCEKAAVFDSRGTLRGIIQRNLWQDSSSIPISPWRIGFWLE